MKKFLYALLAVLVTLVILVAPVSAAPASAQEAQEAPDLSTFLQWLVGGPGAVMAVSWLLERMKWFQALTSEQKQYTVFGAAAAVGCGALAVVKFASPAFLDAVAPFFMVVSAIFVSLFVMKAFHSQDK